MVKQRIQKSKPALEAVFEELQEEHLNGLNQDIQQNPTK